MARKLHRRPEADADLASIWSFIAADSIDAADAVLDRIGDVFLVLLENPLLGRDRVDLNRGLRSFPAGPYVVFYFPTADGIEIVRVLHGRREISDKDVR